MGQTKGVVYKIGCLDCNFVYIGQTDRALWTWVKEHRRAVNNHDKNSKIAQHANKQNHSIDFGNTTIVDKATNYHKRLFLEAWYSQRNPNQAMNTLTFLRFINHFLSLRFT